ncbi:ras-induced vulval development antagonist-domain-containing protein [Coemansia mojavensis]|nr:ras-induced vulval development antagonist-domain-containing protein [Coemansia mojavensis]
MSYSRSHRDQSRSRSPRYDRDRKQDRGLGHNRSPRREHSRRRNRDYYDRPRHSSYRSDRRARSRSVDRHQRDSSRGRHRQRADKDKYRQSGEELRDRREGVNELTMPIWAPTPTASEDEKDRLDEESIIAKMQSKLNAGPAKLHSDAGSESYSDGSTNSQSAKRSSRKHKKRRSEKRSRSHRSERKRPKTVHRRKRDTSDESDELLQKEDHGLDKHNTKPDDTKRYLPSESESSDDSEPEVGPMPAQLQTLNSTGSRCGFSGTMLSSADASTGANAQSKGHISRQGEITKQKIGRLESAGYVMSGNRHRRINDVQLRKEGQAISTEEKRQMLLQSQEERQQKEMQIISEFRDMLAKKK